MTREDLIKFDINRKWRNARIRFCEEQKETINRLGAILSDMPKGSRIVYDNEAENLTRLLDQINSLEEEINQATVEVENNINKQLQQLEPKYGLLLYHHYILGESIKHIANNLIHNEIKYTYKLRDKALDAFDKLN